MKATVSVSARGGITLPAKLRREAGIGPDQTLIAETTGGGILLRPAVTLPVETYKADRGREFDEAERESSETALRRLRSRSKALTREEILALCDEGRER